MAVIEELLGNATEASDAAKPYIDAFRVDGPYCEYLEIEGKALVGKAYSRFDVVRFAVKGAGILEKYLVRNDRCLHYFTENRFEDLIFRLASVLAGTTPVTVNWQADDDERINYKATQTDAKLALVDAGAKPEVLPEITVLDAKAELSKESTVFRLQNPQMEDTRIIIFTSGTTGQPKGVKLSYRSYEANRRTFDDFLQVDHRGLSLIATNPFHHTNTTATTDWSMRKPNAILRLVQRYTTQYWKLIVAACLDVSPFRRFETDDSFDVLLRKCTEASQDSETKPLIVCPLVSRHIDFLESLCSKDDGKDEEEKVIPTALLKKLAPRLAYLLGSAPVGPTTVRRLSDRLGAMPVVRFGSTETCLQVAGTHLIMSESERLGCFHQGWSHEYPAGTPCVGYYIGRDHRPHTEVKVVKSVDPESSDFLTPCSDGEPGSLVTKGANLLSGYVGLDDKKVIYDGWYINLGDIAFQLGRDLFWYSRDSAMLIRGGANYAYDQINADLRTFVTKSFPLQDHDFRIAVVGLKIHSEHEDSCCVTLDLLNDHISPAVVAQLQTNFLSKALAKDSGLSKGSKPDHFRLASIPTNFKGLVLLPDLVNDWKATLGI